MTKNIAFKDVNQGTALVTGTLPLTPLVIEGLEDFKGSFDRLCLRAGTAAIEAKNCACSAVMPTVMTSMFSYASRPRTRCDSGRTRLLTGKVDEARTLYLKCARERLDAKRSGASVMLRDFAAIREAGLTHDLMAEVEKVISRPEKNRGV